MKRTMIHLMSAAFVAALAMSANAATSVNLTTATGNTVAPGGTITLEVRVTANAGETDNTIFGAITYQDALVNHPTPAAVMNTPIGFLSGALTCTTLRCIAFSAVTGGAPVAMDASQNTNFLISTVTFTADPTAAIGSVLTFNWQSTPSTQGLDFFGTTSSPGVTVTVVPEPTTAALLALGILGLGFAGRRRA